MADKQNTGKRDVARCLMLCALCVVTATALSWLFRYLRFPETNIVVVYIFSVLITARYTRGFAYGIAAAVMATCAFNYFFTDPQYTLSVNDPTYFITFAIMSLTSLFTSALTSKVKQTALEAQEKEAEASALFQLTNQLTAAPDTAQIASATVQAVSQILDCQAACLCFGQDGQPERSYIQQKSPGEQIHRSVKDARQIKRQAQRPYQGEEFFDWPISGKEAVLGIVRVPVETAQTMTDAQRRLLRAMIESTALAMDRYRSVQERIKSREETIQERVRGNLLRAISHDLRTPLSGIMGTSEMLMGMTDPADSRYALAAGIYKDADWLRSLMENILSLTRLQDSKLILNKQMEAVEEVVGVAVQAIGKRAPEREIDVHIPDSLLLVPMDAKLIDQALVNLLDNAVRHTPAGREISITVTEEAHAVSFTVADRGEGIAEADLPHIFQMFYTNHGKQPDAQRGVGLGLAICESIVKAHGGEIWAQNRSDGPGAAFTFTLPLEVEA